MNKNYKKAAICGLVLANMIGISQVSALEPTNGNEINLENTITQERDKTAESILNNPNYDTTISVKEEKFDEHTIMILETIEYKSKENQSKFSAYTISNGTKFGSYATAKFYDKKFGHYQGTLNVDSQGQKINSNSAKINYIRTTSSGFNDFSAGVKRKWGEGKSGNPAQGGVEVGFTYYAPDRYGSYKTEGRYIYVEAHPSGKLIIKTPSM